MFVQLYIPLPLPAPLLSTFTLPCQKKPKCPQGLVYGDGNFPFLKYMYASLCICLFETCVRDKCIECHDMIVVLGRYIYIVLMEKPAWVLCTR
jgi:hypothetical protein